MGKEDYIKGDWTDSDGNVNRISFKKSWGEHVFTEDENSDLLAGKEISFPYKGHIVTGHLQYYMFNDSEHFGFRSNYPREGYDDKPVFHKSSDISSYDFDEKAQEVMSEYMRLYYYSKLLNGDGTKVADYVRFEDENTQETGVDITFTLDGKQYIVDEKAQLDYILNPQPLPTFSLELLNAKSGAIGWFINPNLKTEYYMFIWPHSDEKPLSLEGISYAYYALVNKSKLLIEVEKRYGKNKEQLLEIAKRIAEDGLGEEVKDDDGVCKGYRYKKDGFDDEGYLYYTISKHEHPVNLVVRRKWLEDLSDKHGIIIPDKK